MSVGVRVKKLVFIKSFFFSLCHLVIYQKKTSRFNTADMREIRGKATFLSLFPRLSKNQKNHLSLVCHNIFTFKILSKNNNIFYIYISFIISFLATNHATRHHCRGVQGHHGLR